jgi:hypothetical protein
MEYVSVDMEYFCTYCLQLRLTYLRHPTQCQNCMSGHIVVGERGTLDADALRKKYDRTPEENSSGS